VRVNDTEVFRYVRPVDASIANWPFDLPFFIVFNVAVGGLAVGPVDMLRFLTPVELEVDWIRVYGDPGMAEATGGSSLLQYVLFGAAALFLLLYLPYQAMRCWNQHANARRKGSCGQSEPRI